MKFEFTPELVKEAYNKTNLKPMQNDYFPEDGFADCLGVVYKYLNKDEYVDIELWYEEQGYNDNFIQSVSAGFDNIGYNNGNQQWYQLGKDCYKIIKDEMCY